MTPLGIVAVNFWLAMQFLHQLCHCVPSVLSRVFINGTFSGTNHAGKVGEYH